MQEETHDYSELTEEYNGSVLRTVLFLGTVCVVCIVLILAFAYFINSPSQQFPVNTIIEIPEGQTVAEITGSLESLHIVRSDLYLQAVVTYFFDDAFVQAGRYVFTEKKTTREVAETIITGADRQPHLVLTIPEGLDGEGMAEIIEKTLPHLATELTATVLDEHIGFLFPETYFVDADVTAKELTGLMQATYETRTEAFREQIGESVLTEAGIITLASIVEREANTEESMRIVAGILWSRMALGMPLQVDAAFEYLLGKTSTELTDEDLRIDSPYNTYINKGLPPTPIANPGLRAIDAVLNPIETEYLYYLTGVDGAFYYATTFEEHKKNKERYLR